MGKGGTAPLSRRSHPKAALPEGGYRVSPIGAKSPFPRRDGDTQALSRRFCGHDGETQTTFQEDYIL